MRQASHNCQVGEGLGPALRKAATSPVIKGSRLLPLRRAPTFPSSSSTDRCYSDQDQRLYIDPRIRRMSAFQDVDASSPGSLSAKNARRRSV